MSLVILRATLLARCTLCIGFVWYFLSTAPSSAHAILSGFEPYAFADGVLALAAALAAWAARWRGDVIGIGVLGGMVRVLAALAIRNGPGIPYFAVTYLLYVGELATLAFFIGLMELREARRLRSVVAWHSLSILFALEGAANISLGVIAFVVAPEPENVRRFLTSGALLEALSLAALLVLANPVGGRDSEPAATKS